MYEIDLKIELKINLSRLKDRTNKDTLAKLMNLSRRAIYNYHELAVNFVDDFVCDYPYINKQPITKIGLSRYQCWVLLMLRKLVVASSFKVVEQQLLDSLKLQSFLTKDSFNCLYSLEEDTAC